MRAVVLLQNSALGDDQYHGNGAAIHILGTLRQDANVYINNTVISENTGQCNVLLESIRCTGMKNTVMENNTGIGMCVHNIGGGCSFQDPIWLLGPPCVNDCPFDFSSAGIDSTLSPGTQKHLLRHIDWSSLCSPMIFKQSS